jgi:hypothetical protein
LPQAVMQIAPEVTQDADSSGVAMFLPDLLEASQFEPGSPNGFVPLEAVAHVDVNLMLEMKAHLFIELALDDVAPKERAQAMKQIVQHRGLSTRPR